MSSVSKHAFPKKDCSQCPTRRNRIREIARLEGDIALLTKFDIPAPIATSMLETAKHFQAQCNSGRCHS